MAQNRTTQSIAVILLTLVLAVVPSLAVAQEFDICGPGHQPKSECAALTYSLFATLTPVGTGIAKGYAGNLGTAEMILKGMIWKPLIGV
jgi:hypothetical protein